MRDKGIFQAVSVVGYVSLVAVFMNNATTIFGDINKFFGPILFLTLFITSALTCGLLVFYRPYQLFMEKKGKEAIALVVETTKWLAVLLAILFAILFFV